MFLSHTELQHQIRRENSNQVSIGSRNALVRQRQAIYWTGADHDYDAVNEYYSGVRLKFHKRSGNSDFSGIPVF